MNTVSRSVLRRLLLIAAAAILPAITLRSSAADELSSIFNGKDMTDVRPRPRGEEPLSADLPKVRRVLPLARNFTAVSAMP